MTNKKTLVVGGFPACGKSFMYKHFNGKPYTILDSDSSKFSWIYENGVKTNKRNPNFINDYIQHIKENIGKVDVIFVSTHSQVRKALRENNIKHIIVYPSIDMKDEMLKRMNDRGNDRKFIMFQKDHYEEFINEIKSEYYSITGLHSSETNENNDGIKYFNKFRSIELQPGEYLDIGLVYRIFSSMDYKCILM